MVRQDSALLWWNWVGSRVQWPCCEALLEACLFGKHCSHLPLELRWGSGSLGRLEKVLGQLRAEEGHLGQTVPSGGRG